MDLMGDNLFYKRDKITINYFLALHMKLLILWHIN
jgi:hypothetical protein